MHVRTLILAGTALSIAGDFRCARAVRVKQCRPDSRAAGTDRLSLKQQLQILQDNVNALQAKQKEVAAAVPAAKPAPHVTESSSHRFAMESADGQYSVGLQGVIQADTAYYAA